MADIVATPVTQPVYIWANGFFDQLIIGLPLYFWIFVIFISVGVLMAIFMYYVWFIAMSPVTGYYTSYRNGKPIGFVISRTRRAKLIALSYISKVFEAMDMPYAWLLTSNEATFSLGGISALIANDDWGIIRDPAMEDALRILKDRYNGGWTNADGVALPAHEKESERIKNFDKFQQLLMDGSLNNYLDKDGEINGVRLPPFRIANLWDMRQYLASVDSMDSASHEGLIRSEVERRLKQERSKDAKPLYFIAGGGIVFLVCCVFGYIILSGAKCTP